MKIKVDKYSGASYLNTLRQIALTRLKEIRPIAFKVGAFSNVLTINDSVEEDMTEFISKISSSVFSYEGNAPLFKWKGIVNRCLAINELAKDGLGVVVAGCKEILHCDGCEEAIIYFRNDCGKFTREENIGFLRSNSVNTDDLVVVASRHSPIKLFAFEKVGDPDYEGNVEYELSVCTKGIITEEIAIRTAAMLLANDSEAFIKEIY